ncbi:hypothetical protein ACH4T9_31055 [Micromonospora sp. NPDC020750]|uniref:hypothetical protein n=1 Tax=unclassified Micromonospora TaxID=2617518 RepID=UPI0037AC191A
MTAPYRVTGTVPPDSPLRRLAGRDIAIPAADLGQVIHRVAEARRAGIRPLTRPVRL